MFQYIWVKWNISHVKRCVDAGKSFEAAVNERKSRLYYLRKQLTVKKMTLRIINGKKERVSTLIADTLTLVSRSMPNYTRITSIQQEGSAVEISGLAMYQNGIVEFGAILEDGFRSEKIGISPEKVEDVEGRNERKFKFTLNPI
jgi:hypothetical protein